MLYALLCYNDEDTVWAWDKTQDAAVMAALDAVRRPLEAAGKLGPSLRLLPTTAATTLRKSDPPLVIDGPYAETKEQLLGFYSSMSPTWTRRSDRQAAGRATRAAPTNPAAAVPTNARVRRRGEAA